MIITLLIEQLVLFKAVCLKQNARFDFCHGLRCLQLKKSGKLTLMLFSKL